MNKNKLAGALLLALATCGTANAQDITFKLAATADDGTSSVPMPALGQKARTVYIKSQYYYGITKKCTILYHQDSCKIEDFPNGNSLVTYSWGRPEVGKSVQKVAGWMNVNLYSPAEVLIPSSNIHFYTVGNKSSVPGLKVYGRASYEAQLHGTDSLQTTINANNLGHEIVSYEHHNTANGVKLPMLAGCMSVAVLADDANNITNVRYPTADTSTGPLTTTLCVPGNDTDTFVGIDVDKLRITSISTEVPAELSHLYK